MSHSSQTLELAQSEPTRRIDWRVATVLALIVLAGLSVRLYRIDAAGLWHDELLTLENSTGRGKLHKTIALNQIYEHCPSFTTPDGWSGVGRIWTSLDQEDHPPLYYLLLGTWRIVVGQGTIASRLFSASASLLGLLILFDLVRLLHGAGPALWAAGIAALAGPQIYFSQEARSYTLALMILLAAANALARLELFGYAPGRIISLAAALLCLMLTHYLALASLVTLFVYTCVRARGRLRLQLVAAFVSSGLVYGVIWGPFLLRQHASLSAGDVIHAGTSDPNIARATLSLLARLPMRLIAEPMSPSKTLSMVSGVALVLPFLMLRRNPRLLLCTLLMIGPALQAAAQDLVGHFRTLDIPRYFFLATGPAYAVFAGLLAERRGWLRHIVPATLMLSAACSLQSAYARWDDDLRQPAAAVRQAVGPNDLLLFTRLGPGDWRDPSNMLGICHYAQPPSALAVLDRPPAGSMLGRIDAADHVWLYAMGVQSVKEIFPAEYLQAYASSPDAGTLCKVDWKAFRAAARPLDQ